MSRPLRILVAATATVAALTLPQMAEAHHRPAAISKVSVIERIYPDLHARALRDRPVSWNRLRRMAAVRWDRQHPKGVRAHAARVEREWVQSLVAKGTPSANRELGRVLAARRGWTGYQWAALDGLWSRESGWSRVWNRAGSGACHIPQALPCSKIPGGINASSATAIEWGLGYIAGRHGSPAGAKAHSDARGWY